jgi:oxygen-independent coproporphyrinogen-3 oxidase
MFNAIVDAMEEAGYEWVGLDSFARADDALVRAQASHSLSHNKMGYNAHGSTSLLGFGASAISEVNGACVENHADISGWASALKDERLPLASGTLLSESSRKRRDVLTRLLSNMEHDGQFSFEGEADDLAQLQKQGYLAQEEDRVVVTTEGRYLLHHLCGNAVGF